MKAKSKSIFFLFLFLLFTLISFSSFIPYVKAEEGPVNIVSNDLIKNFEVESFNGEAVGISGATNDGKLMFEPQASWNINSNDVWLLGLYTQGDDVYIRYKVAMTTNINMYTTIELNQGAENNQLYENTTQYRVAYYRHNNWLGYWKYAWTAYTWWNHYDFGNIRQWNLEHNSFSGDLVMSFDIAQNLLPNFTTASGDSLMKNFDYIAVSSVAVTDNTIGHLNKTAPTIVGLTPREYESDEINSKEEDNIPNGDTEVHIVWRPDIHFFIPDQPFDSAGTRIIPQSINTTMNPRCKDGSLIWDPQKKQNSMTDCRIIYHISSLSPEVTKYTGGLSYHHLEVTTKQKVLGGVSTSYKTDQIETWTNDIALHVSNRYIQSKIRVVFDIFCSYKIDVGADGIEDYILDYPREYYDLLLWLTTVDGFGGGEQVTTEPDWFDFLDDLFDSIEDIIIFIIIIAIIGIGLYVFVVVGVPMLKGRQTRKQIETRR